MTTHATRRRSPSRSTELTAEQNYFDAAYEAREHHRSGLGRAPHAAAGNVKVAAAVRNAADRAAEAMGTADQPVAFGRIDLGDGSTLYVGDHSISSRQNDVLVVNYRARAAAAFYEATVKNPMGLARRRRFTTKRNTIQHFDDVVFADLLERVDSLSENERWGIDDSILSGLDSDRSGSMRDIARTIQASQYALMRAPLDQCLIIQGGPGTGKSAVALHRVSWLLYNHKTLSAEQVLVVGPNSAFSRYVRDLLPNMGDRDVVHRHMQDIGPVPSTSRLETEVVARIKGRADIAQLLARGLYGRIKAPEGDGLLIATDRGTTRLLPEDIIAAVDARRTLPYSKGRSALRMWVASTAVEQVRRDATVQASEIDRVLDRIWPSLTAQAFLQDLFGSTDRLLDAAGDAFTAEEVRRLSRPRAQRVTEEEWSDADVPLLDEVAYLLTGDVSTYRHVVVDEAQDLSPMQLRMISRRCPSGSFTVVGDLAQSTSAWARDSWDDVGQELGARSRVTIEELELGYRVPSQVFDLAARLLPVAAPAVTPPRVVRTGPATPEFVLSWSDALVEHALDAVSGHLSRGRFTGLVVSSALLSSVEQALRRNQIEFSSLSSGRMGRTLTVGTAGQVKGLEFDAVVVADPERIVAESTRGHRLLYVALTRTTAYLTLVHTGQPLPGIDGKEPGTRGIETTGSSNAQPPEQRNPSVVENKTSGPTATAAPTDGAGTRRTDRAERAALAQVNQLAKDLAEEVLDTVLLHHFPTLLEHMRRELGVSSDELRRLMGDDSK